MNTDKHLILIKDEDKTEKVKYCKYEDGSWQVNFGGNKTYSYNYHNVKWLRNPEIYSPATTVVYHNNQPLSGIEKILYFGDYIRVCFATGYKKIYRSQEVTIDKSCLSNPDAHNTFEYLKQLAENICIAGEEEMDFLYKQYERISYISSNSVLAKYLYPLPLSKSREPNMPIFPFGFNLSQKTATENALSAQISVIQGPPGTGKTQTILNILANAIINNKTVAVVSNNNSATANVLEKLQKYDMGFIAAPLGNMENKEKFFKEQPQEYSIMDTWRLNHSEYQSLYESLRTRGKELKSMLETKNKVALLKQELSKLSLEREYFNTYYKETNEEIEPYRSLFRHTSETVMKLWLEFQRIAEKDIVISTKHKLLLLLRYGITSFSFYENSIDKTIAFFQKLYYERRLQELDEQIRTLTKRLENYRFEDAMKKYSEDSMKLFKAKLADRYSGKKQRKQFIKESLLRDFESFIGEYPVILSTNHSLRNSAADGYLFDYVIMDEASQADIVSGALALSCAKNAVIVGDLKQLPNVVPDNIKQKTDRVFERFKLNRAYNYAENSMLSSIIKLYPDAPRTLLREHYRCRPKIIEFCNQKFYNNELIVLTDEAGREKPLVAYKTAKGNHARGKYNQRQIDVILDEVLPQQTDETIQSIGIVSPYRLQTDKIKETIGTRNIEVDTVHKYQGREKDVIILTTVVNEINEFVDNPNLVNVAVSRAVDKLVVIVSDNEANSNTNIGDLIRFIEYNNFEIKDSNIYSVFDLLYHRYSEHLFETMKNRKRVSEYESENLINAVIEKVLSLPEFQNLDRVMHQPLKMLIRNPDKLNDDECRFAMNILTHTDFLIFNKMDKKPVLVVEVDGYAYHANNPKQIERDRMKDAILNKYGIPILRIRTNESGEEKRFRDKLAEILDLH